MRNLQAILTIGISELLTIDRVPAILLEYKKSYPKVNISLKLLDHHDITSNLQNGYIDLVLVLEKDDWFLPELHCEKLKRERMVLISPPKKEVDMRTVLYTERTCGYTSVFEDYIKYMQMDVKEILEFQSVEAIKQCVKGG